MQKGHVKFIDDTVLAVVRGSATVESSRDSGLSVEIHGLSGIDCETLTMFLENPRKSGGGKTRRVQFSADSETAVVIFEDSAGK